MRIALIIFALLLLTAAPTFAQMPPTPTALPPGMPHFAMPTEFSIWGGTSTAIQVWNWIGDGRTIVQGLAIIGLVIAGMFIVYKFIKGMTRRDAEQ